MIYLKIAHMLLNNNLSRNYCIYNAQPINSNDHLTKKQAQLNKQNYKLT
jgi:hypothetical protein